MINPATSLIPWAREAEAGWRKHRDAFLEVIQAEFHQLVASRSLKVFDRPRVSRNPLRKESVIDEDAALTFPNRPQQVKVIRFWPGRSFGQMHSSRKPLVCKLRTQREEPASGWCQRSWKNGHVPSALIFASIFGESQAKQSNPAVSRDAEAVHVKLAIGARSHLH
jgi:hypothetical protein